MLLCAAAFALLARRDDGAGLLVPRPGPPNAAPALARPAGLAFRLQRGALIGWAVGLFFGGLSIGLTAQDADSILGDSKEVDELFAQAAGSLVDNYLAVSLLSMALIGTGFALRPPAEDARARRPPGGSSRCSPPRSRGRAGRSATSRWRPAARWSCSPPAGSAPGSPTPPTAATSGGCRCSSARRVAIAPAVWVLIGLAVALFGLLPRAVAAVWGALAACYLAAFLGPLLGLPDWVMDLSPFTHVPLLPAAGFDVVPLLVLTLGRRGVVWRWAGGLPPAERSRVANVNCGWVGRRQGWPWWGFREIRRRGRGRVSR